MQRADSDALYHLHQTTLANVCDLQVVCARQLDAEEGAAREAGPSSPSSSTAPGQAPRRLLNPGMLPGLGLALKQCPGLQAAHGAALTALKKSAQDLFVPERGGSYDVWKQRPMPPPILEYAAADVAHLHTMREAWGGRVSAEEMREITSKRISKAIKATQPPKGPHMAYRDF